MKIITKTSFALYLILVFHPLMANDWPSFLGPNRDGSATSKNESFLKEPLLIWSAPVGIGFSGPIIFKENVFLHHRTQNLEEVTCYNLTNGKVVWKKTFPTTYQDDFSRGDGPRSTPAINLNHIVCLSPDGILRALNIINGELLWEKNLVSEFEAGKIFFGIGTSPLLLDNKVIVMAGGKKAGCLCLNSKDGSIIWKSESFKGSYASPVLTKFNSVDSILLFQRDGLSLLKLEDGTTLGFHPWRARFDASVNASTPLIDGNNIFISASYGTGGVSLKYNQGKFEKVWSNDTSLSCHFSTPILANGLLFGFHGRQESGTEFRCVDSKSGDVLWSKDGLGTGNMVKFNKHYLVLAEDGTLFLNKLNDAKWENLISKQVLNSACRAQPAFSDKFFIARDSNKLICLRILE